MQTNRQIEFSALTDQGLVRQNNEDSFIVLDGQDQYYAIVLADGMGGYNRGELASNTAMDYVVERLTTDVHVNLSVEDTAKLLREIVEKANVKVYLKSLEDEATIGMGTTLTVGVFKGKQLIIAHVGDCRVSLLRKKEFTNLTIDHTLVQMMIDQGELQPDEAITHPNKNMVTRALGTPDYVNVDVSTYILESGDRLVFSSDGLHDYVYQNEIKDILKNGATPKDVTYQLVDMANQVGGEDNVTVIVAFVL